MKMVKNNRFLAVLCALSIATTSVSGKALIGNDLLHKTRQGIKSAWQKTKYFVRENSNAFLGCAAIVGLSCSGIILSRIMHKKNSAELTPTPPILPALEIEQPVTVSDAENNAEDNQNATPFSPSTAPTLAAAEQADNHDNIPAREAPSAEETLPASPVPVPAQQISAGEGVVEAANRNEIEATLAAAIGMLRDLASTINTSPDASDEVNTAAAQRIISSRIQALSDAQATVGDAQSKVQAILSNIEAITANIKKITGLPETCYVSAKTFLRSARTKAGDARTKVAESACYQKGSALLTYGLEIGKDMYDLTKEDIRLARAKWDMLRDSKKFLRKQTEEIPAETPLAVQQGGINVPMLATPTESEIPMPSTSQAGNSSGKSRKSYRFLSAVKNGARNIMKFPTRLRRPVVATERADLFLGPESGFGAPCQGTYILKDDSQLFRHFFPRIAATHSHAKWD